jgi:hypothetical protein
MQQSFNDALNPRTVIEILKRTFIIYRDNLAVFLTLSALIIIPLAIIQFIVVDLLTASTGLVVINDITQEVEDIDFSAFLNISIIFSLASFVLQQIILNGLITYLSSEYTMGRSTTPTEALQAIGDRFVPLGLSILFTVSILIAVIIVLSFLFFLCGLGIGVMIYLGVTLYALLIPVMILERVGVQAGVSRAFALGRIRFWPLFWLLLATLLITFLLSLVFTVLEIIVGGNAVGGSLPSLILSTAFTVVISPVMPIALTLMYYDTRVRLEGLDLALAAVPSDTPRPSDVPSQDFPVRITGQDVTTMAILSVGLIVVLILVSFLLAPFLTIQ